jgi:hypothetical protein
MYSSRVPHAVTFRKWASSTLGVLMAGDQVHRKLLAGNLRFDVNLANIPDAAGIYGLLLGLVGDLREALGIPATFPNTWYVVKYGWTISMLDRMNNRHKGVYGKIPGAKLTLWVFKEIRRMPFEATDDFKSVLHNQESKLAERLRECCRPWKCTWAGQDRRELMLVPDLRFLSPVYSEVAGACAAERDSSLEALISGYRERERAMEHEKAVVQAEKAVLQAKLEGAERIIPETGKIVAVQDLALGLATGR